MGIFDTKEDKDRLKNLEKNVQKVFNFTNSLAEDLKKINQQLIAVEKRSPEYEKEAKQSSKKTSEYRNKAQETLTDVELLLSNAITSDISITNYLEKLQKNISDVKIEYDNVFVIKEEVLEARKSVENKIVEIEDRIDSFEEILSSHPDLETEISEFETLLSRIKDTDSKSIQLVKSITSRKNEIDTLYNEILGYKETDADTGEETFVQGLKNELIEAYDGLDEKITSLIPKVKVLEQSTTNNFNNFLKSQSEKGASQITEWEEKYTSLNKKIESLLPNALTAGLSHAFSGKKVEEVSSYDKHKLQFGFGIIGMVTVSLIPFIISIVTIMNDDALDIVINRVPKIVIAILPLYIPVLWLSISSSKKMNLSKRLIEEYSHKEVLSKTYEGLSKQISDLGEDQISEQLRITLLQNFLQMYSENPGKLISDYNNSDHPIMELLENSSKLENTIEKLNKIPGMGKIVELLERKSTQRLSSSAQKIERNIDRAIGLNDVDDEKSDNDEEVV